MIDAEPIEFDWPQIDEHSAAAMCYTSGTTGNPKGVVYSHRSSYLHTMAACSGNAMGLGGSDSVLSIVPMFHANAWGMPYAALMAGADLVCPIAICDARSLIDMIETHGPRSPARCRPSGTTSCIAWKRTRSHDISSLRLVICGGSAVPVSLMRIFEEKHGVQIRQLWGMTETSPLATIAWPPRGTPADQHWAFRGTAGQPMCGVEARIVDDDGRVLPNDAKPSARWKFAGRGSPARITVDATRRSSTSGWLRTGDVGRIDSRGYITLTDRSKDVIKSGGEWISSVELENCLVGHPEVIEAAVVGVPDDRWQERPLAVVVLRGGLHDQRRQLREYLRDKVVRWWLPERWTFVTRFPAPASVSSTRKSSGLRYADDVYDVIEVRD